MKIPVKVDITAGGEITPKEIRYDFKLMFEDRSLQILSTILKMIKSSVIAIKSNLCKIF